MTVITINTSSAADGQRIFLHSINARCLALEYGSMEQCPHEIEAAVLQLDELLINDESRKRYKFLSHLPLGSDVLIAELDLSQYLSDATKAVFAGV